MNTAYIIDAARTPRGIGKPGKGALAGMHPQHLLSTVLKAIAERNNLNTAEVDDVIIGCSMQQGMQDNDIARMSLLDAGWDIKASGVTIDRFCGSGISSVNMAAASIMSGMEDLTVGGGVEMMSLGASFNMQPIMDANNLRLRELHPQSHQGVCADAIATLEGITRADVDALSVQSQERAAHALANGHFDKGVVPVFDEAGNVLLAQDEYPRAGTTFETLSQLNPAFGQLADYPLDDTGVTYRGLIKKTYPDLEIDHIHHAGNSSGIVDGAAAILLASEDYVKKNNLEPRAKIIAMANMGDSPELMLNAPVAATKKVLAKAGMTIDDIDLFEINEAFAVVACKYIRDLGLDENKVNVNGGAIALGHPIGATGSVLITTVLDELERRDLKTGLVTMCAAGGMAPAIIIQRV